MSNFGTVLRGALFAILWTNAGLVIATEVPADASADADEHRAIQGQLTPDTANTRAASQSEQYIVAEHEVKSMVEGDVRLELSQRLAIFSPPS